MAAVVSPPRLRERRRTWCTIRSDKLPLRTLPLEDQGLQQEAHERRRNADAVYCEIDVLAEAYVERSAGVLTKDQAIDRVLEACPDLLAEYRDARRMVMGKHQRSA